MATAIEFNHVGKQYRLGLVSTGTLSHDLNRWWHTAILRQEDPYLKIGAVNDRTQKADSDYVWALRDIDFRVEQGDVVGIIGKNGAGKSTLLKLLSKVTGPTVGTIRARGRIASLLEVGTGFHQEMTGRENIFMNGAILGMTKQEIAAKLDEIVDFSGCEKYLDTPVKRYSSGMMVRLGFAVAAHLDPEILVVDEVLAVGDAEFQKKAIGKMQDVSKGEGRTVLFVSHNMASVQSLCKSGLLLNNGQIETSGPIADVIARYLSGQSDINGFERKSNGGVLIKEFRVSTDKVGLGDNLIIDIVLEATRSCERVDISFDIKDTNYSQVAHVCNYDSQFHLLNVEAGKVYKVQCEIQNINLAPGNYAANIWVGSPYEMFDWIRECVRFYVMQNDTFIMRETPYDATSKVVLPSTWRLF